MQIHMMHGDLVGHRAQKKRLAETANRALQECFLLDFNRQIFGDNDLFFLLVIIMKVT